MSYGSQISGLPPWKDYESIYFCEDQSQGAERFPFCLACRVFGTDSHVDTTKHEEKVRQHMANPWLPSVPKTKIKCPVRS